jgi:hypothetical protein
VGLLAGRMRWWVLTSESVDGELEVIGGSDNSEWQQPGYLGRRVLSEGLTALSSTPSIQSTRPFVWELRSSSMDDRWPLGVIADQPPIKLGSGRRNR